MKETLAIQFNFSLEEIRQSLAITTGKAFTDDALKEQFINREILKVDMAKVDKDQSLQMCMVCSLLIYADNLDKAK